MQDIKALLLEDLTTLLPSLEKVQGIKSFITTEKTLQDAEKLVYKDAAIALGDYSFELERYGVAWDKVRHRVQILYFVKSITGLEESVNNLNLLAANLRLNDFDTTSLINGELVVSYQFTQLTDKINYTILEYSIVEIQGR